MAVVAVVAVVAKEAVVAEAKKTKEPKQEKAKAKAPKETPKTLRITWTKSAIGHNLSQKATIRSLGLTRLSQTVEQPDSPQVRGQIFKVKHLLSVEE